MEGDSIRNAVKRLQSKGIQGSKHGLEGLARTWMASANSYAREEQTKAVLGKRLQGWRYSAVLDSRACLVCGADHGKVFPYPGPRPSLPRHWRCRCLYMPVVEGWKNKPVKETYEQWLHRQMERDPDFVQQVLGKTRMDLFTSGKLTVDRMVTDGRVKRLSEL